MLVYLTLGFFLLMLQSVLLPVNLVVWFLAVGLSLFPTRWWATIAFLLGISWDLISGKNFGFSVLTFETFLLAFYLYSRKWNPLHPMFFVPFVFLGDLVSRRLWGLPWVPWQLFLSGIFALIWSLQLRIVRSTGELKVDGGSL
jgi:hypothetical protein